MRIIPCESQKVRLKPCRPTVVSFGYLDDFNCATVIQRTSDWPQVSNDLAMFHPLSQIGAETPSYCVSSVSYYPLKIEHVYLFDRWLNNVLMMLTNFHFTLTQHNFMNLPDVFWRYCLLWPSCLFWTS